MCGIAGIHFKNPDETGASQEQIEVFVNKLLLGIEHRGKDATGMLTVDANGTPNLVKADTRASTFIQWRHGVPSRPRTVLLHTRLATQGEPSILENNHPVQHGSVYATHNGHIRNDSELFAEEKIQRLAEVDSEIIPALFHKYGMDAPQSVLPQLDGGFAIAVVDPVLHPDKTLLAKGWGSPLEVWESKYTVVWASTAKAIEEALKEAFDFTPKFNKVKTIPTGSIILLDKGVVTTEEFSPFAKPYTYKTVYSRTCEDDKSRGRAWSNAWSDEGDDDLAQTELLPQAVGEFMAEECKSCFCERMFHGNGSDYTGRCNYVTDGGWACRCEGFVPKNKADKDDLAIGLDDCDGCGREFWHTNLLKVGSKRLCRYYCAKDPAVSGTVKATHKSKKADDPKAPGASVRGKSTDDLAMIVYSAMCKALQKDENPRIARERTTDRLASEVVALKTGMSASYALWLLGESTPEIREGDSTGYLNAVYREAADPFYKAWSKIDMAVDDLVDEDLAILDEDTTAEEALV